MTASRRGNRTTHSGACGLHSCLFPPLARLHQETLLIVACAAAEGDYRPGAIPVTEVLSGPGAPCSLVILSSRDQSRLRERERSERPASKTRPQLSTLPILPPAPLMGG